MSEGGELCVSLYLRQNDFNNYLINSVYVVIKEPLKLTRP